MENTARKIIELGDYQFCNYTYGYETGFEAGYKACEEDRKRLEVERKERRLKENRRRLCFVKQKLIGVLMIFLTGFIVKILDGDATIAVITVPLACTMIFSKKKIWMDDYYREEGGKKE